MKKHERPSPYDTVVILFLLEHARWLLARLGIKAKVRGDRSNQLFGSDGRRRFCDLIFDVRLGTGKKALFHVEAQSRYFPGLIVRMLEYKTRILQKFGRVFLIQAVVFLRRPPQKILSRLAGLPTDFGYYPADLTDVSVHEYLQLGSRIATVMAVVSRIEECNFVAEVVVQNLCKIPDPEARGRYLNLAAMFAGLRPDKEQFLEAMDATLKKMRELTPEQEFDKALRYAYSGVYKKGKAEGIKEGKAELIAGMLALGVDPKTVAQAAGMSVEEVLELKKIHS